MRAAALFIIRLLLLASAGERLALASEFPASYCISAYQIAPMISACPDNRFFADAADRCQEKFTAEVDTVSQQLSGDFGNNQRASVSAQNSKQRNNNINLVETDAGFRDLLDKAHLIRKDLKEYITTIILPGNPGLNMLMAYNIYDLLSEDNCYRDNRQRLEEHIAWINQKIAELERVDDKTLELNASTVKRIETLDGAKGSTATVGPLRTKMGQGSVTIRRPAGKTPKPESTITGEITNEKLP